MIIETIHTMEWVDAEHTYVKLSADTSAEEGVLIVTPYDDTSIIWEAVQSFPVEQISEYVEEQ